MIENIFRKIVACDMKTMVAVMIVIALAVCPSVAAPIDFPAYVIPGSNWYVGASAPISSIGSSGDFYLQNSTGMVYQKIIGTWTAQGVLSGPAGTAINESYAYLPGRAGGQTLYGGNAANDDLVLSGTSSSTKTSAFIIIGNYSQTYAKSTLNVFSGITGLTGITITDIDFDNAIKTARTKGLQYDSDEEPYTILYGISSSVANRVSIGGGSSSENSATLITFYLGDTVSNLSGTEKARITSSGYFGLGTTSPTDQLHTTASVRFANLSAGTVYADVNGRLYTISDEKLKTNIRRLTPSGTTNIDKIEALSPTCYHFSSSSGLDTQNEYCGFLAGEVKKVIPEAVKTKQDVKYEQKLTKKGKTTEEDEYETVEIPTGTTTDSLDDRAIIITLVNAMKEQQTQIEQLQAEVAKLEGKKVDKTV